MGDLRPPNAFRAGVYFVQAEDGGPIKIGWSQYPARRVAELQVGSPKRLKLVGFVNCQREMEGRLHELFADEHVSGEWFEPCEHLLAIARGDKALPEPLTLRELAELNDLKAQPHRDLGEQWVSKEVQQTRRTLAWLVRSDRMDSARRMFNWGPKRLLREIKAMHKLGYFNEEEFERAIQELEYTARDIDHARGVA